MNNIILLTTTDIKSGRSPQLDRLISSIELCKDINTNIELCLLLQNYSKHENLQKFPEWVNVCSIEGRLPLSIARNKLLELAFRSKLVQDKSIVAFPDDDCWYPENVLQFIHDAFDQNQELDFLFCRYASNTQEIDSTLTLKQPSAQDVISFASSNTIFVTGLLAKKLNKFSEDLGVGTALNGGEDTEYAIRAYLKARKTLFANRPIIGHRDIDPEIRTKYYPGSFIAISRNAWKSPRIMFAMLRKLLIGIYFLMSGRLDIRSFARALQLS